MSRAYEAAAVGPVVVGGLAFAGDRFFFLFLWLGLPSSRPAASPSSRRLPSQFRLQRVASWLGPGGNGSVCVECVTMTTKVRKVRLQESWKFYFFPFDYQTITMLWSVPSADVGPACARLASTLTMRDDWDEIPDWGLHTADGPPVVTTLEGLSTCKIEIPVFRRTGVYMIKSLLAVVLIVYGGLLTLRINPQIPPLFGGRIGALISAMVIVMLQTNPAEKILGSLTYLVWADIFSICQFVVLVLALVASIYIHHLQRTGRAETGSDVDKVVRVSIPFVVYPAMVFSMLLSGIIQAAWTGALAFCLSVLCGIGLAILQVARERAAKRASVELLNTIEDLGSESARPVIRAVFDSFDEDRSGEISQREMGDLMRAMFPRISGAAAGRFISTLPSGNITFEVFEMLVEQLTQFPVDKTEAQAQGCSEKPTDRVVAPRCGDTIASASTSTTSTAAAAAVAEGPISAPRSRGQAPPEPQQLPAPTSGGVDAIPRHLLTGKTRRGSPCRTAVGVASRRVSSSSAVTQTI